MERQWDRLEDLPLRFVVPDGWREPHPEWVSLHQGFIPPEGWQPYPECTPAPPQWPFWEENGAAWYSFFRYHAPPPSRAIGWWFALSAAGLFTVTVAPFALGYPAVFVPGLIALVALVIGVRGLIRTLRKSTHWVGNDPLERVRKWSDSRREEFFREAYDAFRLGSDSEISRAEFERGMYQRWWRGSPAAEAS